MPPQFLLLGLRCQPYQLTSEGLEPLGVCDSELLCRVSGTHAHPLVRMVYAVYQGSKQCRVPAYDCHYLIGTADGTAIAALQCL